MIHHKSFMAMTLLSLVLVPVEVGTQQQSAIGNLIPEKLDRIKRIVRRNLNPISSWGLGDTLKWEMAGARGEQSEDCLLYGICSGNGDDDTRGNNDNA